MSLARNAVIDMYNLQHVSINQMPDSSSKPEKQENLFDDFDDRDVDNSTSKIEINYADNNKLTDLYKAHKDSISRYLKRILPEGEDPEDFMQDIYVRLLSRNAQNDYEELTRSFLFTVGLNLVRDASRKRAMKATYRHVPYEEVTIIDPNPIADEESEWFTMQQALNKKLQTLNPRTRRVFLLHRVEEMTYREIAKHMKLSERTVERHMRFALLELQSILKKNT